MPAASMRSIRRSRSSSRPTTTHWWWASWPCAACRGGSSAPSRLSPRWPGCAPPRVAELLRQLVLQRHLAQALDLAGRGAAGRHELAGDHAAARHDHALLQRLAMLAAVFGEPRQRIVRMAQHVAGMAGANDSPVERYRAVELVDRQRAPVLV